MDNLLAWLVVILLVGPPTLIVGGELLLLLAAIIPGTPRRVRERFRCPWARQMVTADFLVPEGALHPAEVVSCTAFSNPERITCRKRCRELATVRWALSRGLFPRWALTAGGLVTWRSVAEPAPREPK